MTFQILYDHLSLCHMFKFEGDIVANAIDPLIKYRSYRFEVSKANISRPVVER